MALLGIGGLLLFVRRKRLIGRFVGWGIGNQGTGAREA
ncbi:MAG: hypothetical protein K9N49_04510 [Candidatus Marinimicrobia bacterium]|nr:hypothetical protein [Candidatus Neomarinimicrobiota bacterium]